MGTAPNAKVMLEAADQTDLEEHLEVGSSC